MGGEAHVDERFPLSGVLHVVSAARGEGVQYRGCMTKPRGRQQTERGLKDLTQHPEPEGWPARRRKAIETSGLVETTDSQLIWWTPDEWEYLVCERRGHSAANNELLDFAVVLQQRLSDEDKGWADVARVDTCHDCVHVHRYDREGKDSWDENRVPTDCRDNLDRAITWARGYIWDIVQAVFG